MEKRSFSLVEFLRALSAGREFFPEGDEAESSLLIDTKGCIPLHAISRALEIEVKAISVRGCIGSEGIRFIRVEPVPNPIPTRSLLIMYDKFEKIVKGLDKVIGLDEKQLTMRQKKLYPSRSYCAEDEEMAMEILREVKYAADEGVTGFKDRNSCRWVDR